MSIQPMDTRNLSVIVGYNLDSLFWIHDGCKAWSWNPSLSLCLGRDFLHSLPWISQHWKI